MLRRKKRVQRRDTWWKIKIVTKEKTKRYSRENSSPYAWKIKGEKYIFKNVTRQKSKLPEVQEGYENVEK